MKRKIVSLLIALTLLLSCFSFSFAAESGSIGIYIDGVKLNTTAEPINMKGSVMVPMRDIFEAMGATVEWDQENSCVNAEKGYRDITLYTKYPKDGDIGLMYVNYREKYFQPIPIIVNNKTLVPIRVVAEALDATVEWKDGNVIIATNDIGYEEYPFLPDFGKMFDVALHKKTVNDVNMDGKQIPASMYYYQKDLSPSDAIEKYTSALKDLGFTYVPLDESTTNGALKMYARTDKNVYVTIGTIQNANIVSIVVKP